MIVLQQPVHADRGRSDGALLGRLAQGGMHRRFMAVPGTARRTPGPAVTAPEAALLQQHGGPARRVRRRHQQAGRPVPAPVPMALAAAGPAIPIAHSHPCDDS